MDKISCNNICGQIVKGNEQMKLCKKIVCGTPKIVNKPVKIINKKR